MGVLERLNEQYTVVTALNNAPLLRSRRFGGVSWQSYLAAVREGAGGREDADTSAVDRVLAEESKSDLAPVEATQATLRELSEALSRIGTVSAEKDPANPVNLSRLSEAVRKIRAMLDRVNPPATPVDADKETREGVEAVESGAPDTGSTFPSSKAAERALAEATRYLTASEPSSPALLLLRPGASAHRQILPRRARLPAARSGAAGDAQHRVPPGLRPAFASDRRKGRRPG